MATAAEDISTATRAYTAYKPGAEAAAT